MLRAAQTIISLLLMLSLLASRLAGGSLRQETKLSQAQSLVVAAHAGRVSRVDGEVWLERRGEAERRPLRIGEILSAGDVVLTGAQGSVKLSLNPGSYLQVSARSNVRVYETDLDRMHFDIEQGEVIALVSSFEKGAALELDTPPALLSVVKRGLYRVRVAANDVTEAAVAQGELRFVNPEGKVVNVMKGKRVRFLMK